MSYLRSRSVCFNIVGNSGPSNHTKARMLIRTARHCSRPICYEGPEASHATARVLSVSKAATTYSSPVLTTLHNSIHKAFENPGYMHMCLMLSACQWGWVTGSMESVRIPFLHHKTATYQFAREQLQNPETAQNGDAMLAISALALTEVST